MLILFQRRGHDTKVYLEREDVVVRRIEYLRKMRKARSEGRPVIYMDESWINAGHTTNLQWQDK